MSKNNPWKTNESKKKPKSSSTTTTGGGESNSSGGGSRLPQAHHAPQTGINGVVTVTDTCYPGTRALHLIILRNKVAAQYPHAKIEVSQTEGKKDSNGKDLVQITYKVTGSNAQAAATALRSRQQMKHEFYIKDSEVRDDVHQRAQTAPENLQLCISFARKSDRCKIIVSTLMIDGDSMEWTPEKVEEQVKDLLGVGIRAATTTTTGGSDSDPSRRSQVRSAASAHEFSAYAPILYVTKQTLGEEWEVEDSLLFNKVIKFSSNYLTYLKKTLPESFWKNFLIAAQRAGKAEKCETADELFKAWEKHKISFECDFVASVKRSPPPVPLAPKETLNNLDDEQRHDSPQSTTTNGGFIQPLEQAPPKKPKTEETSSVVYPGFNIKQREDSPPSVEKSAVMFEITEGNQWQYKWCQLEVRMNVYLKKHTPDQPTPPKETDEGTFPCAGLFVPDCFMADVTRSLLVMVQREDMKFLRTIQCVRSGRFAVVTPTRYVVLNPDSEDAPPTRLPAALSLGGSIAEWVNSTPAGVYEQGIVAEHPPQLSEYWVSMTGVPGKSDPVVTNVSATLQKELLGKDIDGLKEAVLKELAVELQGKGITSLTVYRPGKEKDDDRKALDVGDALKTAPRANPYHVVVE